MSRQSSDNTNSHEEQDMQAIFAGIRPLPEPPAHARDVAYAELQQEWRGLVDSRRANRQRRWLSAAAGIAIAFVAGWLVLPEAQQSWTTTIAAGEVNRQDTKVQGELLLTRNDEMLAISDARLRLANGADLRLRHGSRIRWQAADRFNLLSGAAYIDTAEQADVTVDTPFGSVTDIGTRFLVAVTPDQLQVSVREGAARVETPQAAFTAAARPGRAAVLLANSREVRQSEEPSDHERWSWIHNVAPGYQQTLVADLLQAIGRDLGKRVVFASRGVEAAIAHHRVEGRLDNVPPRTALGLVTASAGLAWLEDDGSIQLDFQQ